MIDKVLTFLVNQLESYLQSQQSNDQITLPNVAENVILGNISQVGTDGSDGLNNNVILSLINIEEDRISRPVDNYARVKQIIPAIPQTVYKNPPVYLNLYVLFTAYYDDYASSLLLLSNVVKFFQYKNVFTMLSTPELPPGVGELIFDLKTLSFQDLNNLWGILGSKYIPSVMYKVRLVTISADFAEGSSPLLTEIIVNDKTVNNL